MNTDCKILLKSTIGFSLLDSNLLKTYIFWEKTITVGNRVCEYEINAQVQNVSLKSSYLLFVGDRNSIFYKLIFILFYG